MAAALPLIQFDRFALPLDRYPDAIELDDRGHIGDRFLMGLLQERLDLIDALVDSPQAHTAAQCGTPPFAQIAQTLAQASAKEHVLIQIQPKALEFLDNRPVSHHVVQALLALQHGDL